MLAKTKLFVLLLCAVLPTFLSAQSEKDREKITRTYNQNTLEELRKTFTEEFEENYALALEKAEENGWEIKLELEDGTLMELMGITDEGNPIYFATNNEGAAVTSRAVTLYPGGALGLNLTGSGMTVGLWEVDATRPSHELFEGRVTQVDADALSTHATHVAGTILGGDNIQAGARGMAYDALIRAFNSTNDAAEVAAEAATGNLISSHSYGIPAGSSPAYYIGKYDASARNFDQVMYNAPYYLGVFSAGNDRNNGISPTGYDLLTDRSCNKNGMTIAAVNGVSNYTGPASVVMSNFSSWGPTDDGRIKPDLSAKGVNVYSASSNSNTSYATLSGTSMATPSTSGTLILLQQHYNNLNASFMRSSTLRGLACHTADEAGSNPGPDYEFGWGLLNAERAAQTINTNGGKSIISEITLNSGQTYSINVTASGLEDLMASITWTDPEGTVGPNIVNDQTPVLVNDLDIRITQGPSTFFPWKLDVNNPSFGATKADNLVDNIEKVEVTNPSGIYTITVTHKGILPAPQVFSLIVTGLEGDDCNGDFGGTAYLDNCGTCVGGNTGLGPCVTYCTSTYSNAGSEFISNVNFNTISNPSGDAAVAGYEDFTAINTTVNQGSSYPISITINTAGNYTDHCQVFYDWNNDGDFYDANEEVDLGDIMNVTAGILTGTVNVPVGAAIDTIRMRVNIEYNFNPGPCDADHTSEWGETEDYSVIITSTLPDCNGDIGGTAFIDNCATCVAGNTGLTPCVQDCNGDWGGTAYIDNCATCVAGNTGLTPCVQDCNGDWGGTAYIDNCATCVAGNTGLTPCVQDCNGDWGGTAYIDNCATCVAGNTGLTPCVQDCNGDWGGTAYIDNCATCVAGNTGLTPCVQDCNGDWGGTAYIDNCATCVAGNTGLTPCVQDCNGDWGGTAYIDNCATCVAGNTGLTPCVQDCNGDWGGTAYIDNCATCVAGNTGLNPCVQDCNGDWGGTAYIDNCATCVAGNTGLTPCVQDCNGDWGGTAYIDNCATCVAGNTGLNPCVQDCNGDWGGTAYIDNCATCVAGNTGLTPCVQDCNGDWGGTAYIDNCATCVAGNTGLNPCVQDCNGDWGGTAYLDNCATCVDGNTGLNPCVQDCNGDWGGTAYLDNCATCVDGNTGALPCVQDCSNDWGGTAFIDSCGICAEGNTGITAILDPNDCDLGSDELFNPRIKMYPNPSTGKFTIELIEQSDELRQVLIFSVDGSLVYSQEITGNVLQIDISDREKGVYFIHLSSENYQWIEKMTLGR